MGNDKVGRDSRKKEKKLSIDDHLLAKSIDI